MKIKQSIEELFPTPLWILDVQPSDAAAFNARLKVEIEKIMARPKVPSGSNWQTPQDLHSRPEFAELAQLIEIAARSVSQFLGIEQHPMMITGCWANINPPGSYHPTHNHPNNYLSGVYYVAVPDAGSHLVFQDPRPLAMTPATTKPTRFTSNASLALPQPGRMVIFPSWLRHHVPSNEGTTERISIAFNLMFTNFAETMAAPRWKPSAGQAG
ncbi:TIGR02466 family protein [Reyranella sp.]|uniref:TIGR02466 family protein n=1 Tax=Reyranella sp. TaxID=1929291 RepID=UPI003BAC7C7D